MYGHFNDQLTLAGLWTVFGVAGPSVTDQLTLAGLWTLFGCELNLAWWCWDLVSQTSWPWLVYGHFSDMGHKPADPGWSMDTFRIWPTNQLTLAGLWTLFGVVRPSVTDQLTLAGLWTLFGYWQKCPYTSWPWQVYKHCYTPADPGWSMDKKNEVFWLPVKGWKGVDYTQH